MNLQVRNVRIDLGAGRDKRCKRAHRDRGNEREGCSAKLLRPYALCNYEFCRTSKFNTSCVSGFRAFIGWIPRIPIKGLECFPETKLGAWRWAAKAQPSSLGLLQGGN